jgi:hypothetical protein
MGQGNLAQKSLTGGGLGMTSKVRTARKRPLEGKEAQPQTASEKFCTNPDGVMVFCKR